MRMFDVDRGAHMKSSIVGVRVIAMLSRVLEDTLRMHLEELEVHLDVAHSTTMLSHMTQGNPIYEVAIVPANPAVWRMASNLPRLGRAKTESIYSRFIERRYFLSMDQSTRCRRLWAFT